jgi:hypothetical protein
MTFASEFKMVDRWDALLHESRERRRESRERRQVAKELIERARSIRAKAAQTCQESRQLEKKLRANLS